MFCNFSKMVETAQIGCKHQIPPDILPWKLKAKGTFSMVCIVNRKGNFGFPLDFKGTSVFNEIF